MKQWNSKRPPDSDFYQQNAYPLANVINSKPRKRLNNTTVFLVATAVFFAVSYIFFR